MNATSILKKTAEILNKDLLPTHKSPTDWEKLKADLEGLHSAQLTLVLNLVRKMKIVNKEDKKEAILTRD